MNEEKPAGFTLPAFPRRRRLMLRRRRRRRRARSHNGLPAERAGAHRRVVALFGIAPVPGVACRRKSACRSSRTRRNLNNALHDAGLSRVCHCAHHDARCERRPPEAPALIPAGAMMEGTGRDESPDQDPDGSRGRPDDESRGLRQDRPAEAAERRMPQAMRREASPLRKAR